MAAAFGSGSSAMKRGTSVSIARLATCALTALWVVACNEPPAPTAPTNATPTPKSTLTSVQVTGTPPAAGQESQFHAIATYANGTTADVTAESLWQSEPFNWVSITPSGLATGQRAGPSQITATFQGVSGRMRMLISGPGTYIQWLSEPGDPVGQGLVGAQFPGEVIRAERPEPDRVKMSFIFSPSANVQGFASGHVTPQAGFRDWEFDFVGPAGIGLTPGVVYENALMWPNQPPNRPSMWVWIASRTCDQSSGRFVVHDVVYGGGNIVLKFHATFEQRCPGASGSLRGEVALNR